jgi:hypothetical protein
MTEELAPLRERTGNARATEPSPCRRPASRAGSPGLQVPAGVAARLSELGVPMVVDYAGYARAAGAPGSTVHPWAAVSLHDSTWISGRSPGAARPGGLSAFMAIFVVADTFAQSVTARRGLGLLQTAGLRPGRCAAWCSARP